MTLMYVAVIYCMLSESLTDKTVNTFDVLTKFKFYKHVGRNDLTQETFSHSHFSLLKATFLELKIADLPKEYNTDGKLLTW